MHRRAETIFKAPVETACYRQIVGELLFERDAGTELVECLAARARQDKAVPVAERVSRRDCDTSSPLHC